jgi:hypothetical protein
MLKMILHCLRNLYPLPYSHILKKYNVICKCPCTLNDPCSKYCRYNFGTLARISASERRERM